ncbi:MAG: lysophospholipid acyltransferase family protein [Psychroserpens sp.]|uniref:lysophospholipid acyltransferase family protein n=1 Tax=Psychroserpens sp. TaxID=2020870 RepID=UPI003002ED7B
MKQLWLYSMRAYLRLGLFFYFKKIEVANAENIPKNKPVLFLVNHQNALLDALLIATKNGRFSYFLTRASVFSKPLVSKILKSLRMLPVYRIRDGWGNLSKNNSIFSMSSKLLNEKQAIVIFPEGSHDLRRTVRPLSKGFTRIVFETIEAYPETELYLIPVGLNFKHATKFSDSTLINFGKPIQVSSNLLDEKNKSVLQLKDKVSSQLRQLTTHIESDNYELTLQQLEYLNVDFTNPEDVNKCIASDFNTCKKITSKQNNFLKQFFKFLLIVNLFVPYLIWKKVIQPKIKEIEFTSTFRFTIAITLVPIFVILVMLFLGFVFQIKFAFLYLLNVIVLNLLSVKL